MAGTQSVSADDRRLLGIPRSWQTVAIADPQYGLGNGVCDTQEYGREANGLAGFPSHLRPGPRTRAQGSGLLHRASVVRVRPRTSGSITDLLLALACVALGGVHSTSEKRKGLARGSRGTRVGRATGEVGLGPLPAPPRGPTGRSVTLPDASPRLVGGRCLTRYRNQPDKSLHQSGAAMHHRPQNQERASVCPSQLRPDPVTFPALSQIKPHTPRLVVPFRQFL